MKRSDETVTAAVVHKLNFCPCLLSMFLSIAYTHYELRLGIVSPTELPMTLVRVLWMALAMAASLFSHRGSCSL